MCQRVWESGNNFDWEDMVAGDGSLAMMRDNAGCYRVQRRD